MTWFDVADYATAKMCRQRRQTDHCNCIRKRGVGNPCDDHSEAHEAATQLGLGETARLSVEQLMDWVNRYHCMDSRTYGQCDHSACNKVRNMLAWIDEKLKRQAA